MHKLEVQNLAISFRMISFDSYGDAAGLALANFHHSGTSIYTEHNEEILRKHSFQINTADSTFVHCIFNLVFFIYFFLLFAFTPNKIKVTNMQTHLH